jgi:hypothetical protein
VRAIDPSTAKEPDPCPEEEDEEEEEEEELSKASEGGYFFEQTQRVPFRKCKFPPGREGPFGDEDKDEKGSIRESEQGNSYDDDDDDDGDDEDDEDGDDEDEQRKRRREATAARRVSWEDVKRIIEHPSEDEQSWAGDAPTHEVENEDVSETEEKLSAPNPPESDIDRQDRQAASGGESGSGDRAEDANDVSEPRPLKVETDEGITELILESGSEPRAGQEQQLASD